jgi:hypothetical protein
MFLCDLDNRRRNVLRLSLWNYREVEMRDVTADLPERLISHGAKLFVRADEDLIKYVIENKEENYRTFIHIKVGRESSSIKDLFNKYYFDNNIGVVANT